MCAVATGSGGTSCGAACCGLLCTPGGGASTGKHKGQSIKWCSAPASPCSACATGLGAHCGTTLPEHRRSTPWAAMCARASGAHTPAATTHSHSASTPVMVRRDRCEAGKKSMEGILDTAGKAYENITPMLSMQSVFSAVSIQTGSAHFRSANPLAEIAAARWHGASGWQWRCSAIRGAPPSA